jgi:hypothetical protein
MTRYHTLHEQLQNINTGLDAEADTFVDGMYDGIGSGTINRSNLQNYISPSTLGQEYASDFNATGYPIYAVASLSQAGVAVPDLDNASTMTVRVNGTERQGWVMSQEEALSEWSANTTYDGQNLTGLQFMITTDGERISLERAFTITTIRGMDGSTMDSVGLSQNTYTVSSVEEYQQRQELLSDFRQILENREPNGPGGGDGGGDTPGWETVLAVGGIGALLALAFAARG